MFKWEGHSEVDKYALSVYEKHFPESEALGDIGLIRNTKGLPEKLDLVTFGFPCQDLSVAGKRGGIGASRSGLFTKAMRIIRAKKPSYIIFENVKGLYSSNEGRDFAFVLRTLARAGYDGQWQLLNTRWFLPQNRERVYFVGHLRGLPRPEIFPIGESNGEAVESIKETRSRIIDPNYLDSDFRVYDEYSPCINQRDYKEPKLVAIGGTGKNCQGNRVYSPEGCSVTISSQGGGQGAKTGLYQVPRGFNKGGIKDECGAISSSAFEHNNFVVPVLTPDRPIKRQNGRRFKEDGDPSFTLTGQDHHGVVVNTGIRRLTPLECERLQGFINNWTKYGINGEISDSQRYKMMGNAVSVPVVKAVVMGLLASGIKIETYLDLFSGVGGFRLGIEEAMND